MSDPQSLPGPFTALVALGQWCACTAADEAKRRGVWGVLALQFNAQTLAALRHQEVEGNRDGE